MKCEDFKNRMTILWDKSSDTEEKEELMRHIEECDECRAEYEGWKETITLLSPQHTPQMKKEKGETAKVKKLPTWSKRITRIAAAFLIFVAGVATGLTNLFSVDAHATKSSELVKQALLSMRCAGNFIMELKVRTQPNESFAYFNPDDSMINVRIMSMQMGGEKIWRIEKKGGRTLVCDGNRKYAWLEKYRFVGDINDNMEENFSALLKSDKYDAKEDSFFGKNKHDEIKLSETDSTNVVTVVSDRPGNGLVALYNNDTSDKRNRFITESTFTKRDGLLRKIRIWIERDGNKTLILESQTIAYNVAMSANKILQLPDSSSDSWRSDEELKSYHINESLHQETATEAAKRILQELTENKPGIAKEALFYYGQELDELAESLKGCKATDFSQPQQVENYNGVYVFYELAYPNGEKHKRHVALKFDPELEIWILDGGF